MKLTILFSKAYSIHLLCYSLHKQCLAKPSISLNHFEPNHPTDPTR